MATVCLAIMAPTLNLCNYLFGIEQGFFERKYIPLPSTFAAPDSARHGYTCVQSARILSSRVTLVHFSTSAL